MAMLERYAHMDSPRPNKPRENAIAAEFEDCVQLFYQLCTAMEADSATWATAQVPLADIFSKLRAWGNDTGASSWTLDHALRKASALQEQVSYLLKDLRFELQKGRS